jgi:hypothetical protein
MSYRTICCSLGMFLAMVTSYRVTRGECDSDCTQNPCILVYFFGDWYMFDLKHDIMENENDCYFEYTDDPANGETATGSTTTTDIRLRYNETEIGAVCAGNPPPTGEPFGIGTQTGGCTQTSGWSPGTVGCYSGCSGS